MAYLYLVTNTRCKSPDLKLAHYHCTQSSRALSLAWQVELKRYLAPLPPSSSTSRSLHFQLACNCSLQAYRNGPHFESDPLSRVTRVRLRHYLFIPEIRKKSCARRSVSFPSWPHLACALDWHLLTLEQAKWKNPLSFLSPARLAPFSTSHSWSWCPTSSLAKAPSLITHALIFKPQLRI